MTQREQLQSGGDPPALLIVDCEQEMRLAVHALFAEVGVAAATCATSDEVLAHLHTNEAGEPGPLVLCRLELEEGCGMALLTCLSRITPPPPTIIYSTRGDVPSAVGCFREGALDFIDHVKLDPSFRRRVLSFLPPDKLPRPAPRQPATGVAGATAASVSTTGLAFSAPPRHPRAGHVRHVIFDR